MGGLAFSEAKHRARGGGGETGRTEERENCYWAVKTNKQKEQKYTFTLSELNQNSKTAKRKKVVKEKAQVTHTETFMCTHAEISQKHENGNHNIFIKKKKNMS